MSLLSPTCDPKQHPTHKESDKENERKIVMLFSPVNIELHVNFSIGFLVKPLQIMSDLPTVFYAISVSFFPA